jgi:hypothetical protein
VKKTNRRCTVQMPICSIIFFFANRNFFFKKTLTVLIFVNFSSLFSNKIFLKSKIAKEIFNGEQWQNYFRLPSAQLWLNLDGSVMTWKQGCE